MVNHDGASSEQGGLTEWRRMKVRKSQERGGLNWDFKNLKRFSHFVFKKALLKTYPLKIKTMQEVEIDKLFYPGSLATASYVQSTRQGDLALIPR